MDLIGILLVVGIEQESWHLDFVTVPSRRGVLLATSGVLTELKVELPLWDPVRVEVGGQGGDVAHVGVVHQGGEGDGAAVEEVQDLGSSPRPGNGSGVREDRDQITGSFQHVDANLGLIKFIKLKWLVHDEMHFGFWLLAGFDFLLLKVVCLIIFVSLFIYEAEMYRHVCKELKYENGWIKS